jgi:hypothetical protein
MSNPYSNQQWGPMLYGQQNTQIDPNFIPDGYRGQPQQQGQPQRKQQQQPASYPTPYHYPQQAPSAAIPDSTSSLQGALQSNQATSHSRSSSYNSSLSPPNSATFGAHNGGGYGLGNTPVNQTSSYPSSSPGFNFGPTNLPAPLSMTGPDSSIGSGAFLTTSPRQDSYGILNAPRPNQSGLYQPNATPSTLGPSPHSAKRPRSNDDPGAEDLDAKADPSADKDANKNKPYALFFYVCNAKPYSVVSQGACLCQV